MRANDHLALCSDEGLGQQIERLTVNKSRGFAINIFIYLNKLSVYGIFLFFFFEWILPLLILVRIILRETWGED